jgi:hypothetical protein
VCAPAVAVMVVVVAAVVAAAVAGMVAVASEIAAIVVAECSGDLNSGCAFLCSVLGLCPSGVLGRFGRCRQVCFPLLQ